MFNILKLLTALFIWGERWTFSFSGMSMWDAYVEQALEQLGLLQLLRSLRPITPSLEKLNPVDDEAPIEAKEDGEFKVFDEMQPWDRASVEVEIAESTVQKWLLDIPSSGMLPCFCDARMGCILLECRFSCLDIVPALTTNTLYVNCSVIVSVCFLYFKEMRTFQLSCNNSTVF